MMTNSEFSFRGETLTLDAASRAELPGNFIELPDGVVHYELTGPVNGPLVVLVHGFSVPYFIWDPTFAALLLAGCRVLRYDLYGRGYSDRPLVDYNQALFDRQLLNLLDALEIKTPVNLIGLSMGGVITANFTAQHPERVSKLALIDPAGFPLGYSFVFRMMFVPRLGEILLNLLGNSNLEKSMASDFYDQAHIAAFVEQYRPQMQYKGFKRAMLSTIRSKILEDGEALYQQIGELGVPTLLIWGEEDQTVPFKFSRNVVRAIRQVEFHPIAESKHIPHYEKPEVVNPLLIDFIKR